MMVAETVAPKKDSYIIDVCAAPGGKSVHLAEKLGGTGMVEARDLTEYKTDLIRQNIARHQLSNMRQYRWMQRFWMRLPSENGCGDRRPSVFRSWCHAQEDGYKI